MPPDAPDIPQDEALETLADILRQMEEMEKPPRE
jgi:hypothetical protein